MKTQVKIKNETLLRYDLGFFIEKWIDVLHPTKFTLEDYINVDIPYNPEGGLNVSLKNIKETRFELK